jgi:hypothetical protein
MSRPEKPINWKLVDDLLIAGCLGTEIAPHFDIHPTNFYIRVEQEYGMSFTAYSAEKRQKGDSILRAKQFEKATKGDNTMLVWLGKNRLKQAETPVEVSIDTGTMKQFNEIMSQLNTFQALKMADKSINSEQKSA